MRESVRAEGGKPFPIPAGCSEHPLGGPGLCRLCRRSVRAGSGARLQVRLHRRVFSDGQHAGMVVGFTADDCARRVIGIDASAKPEQTHEQITRIAKQTAELVDLGQEISCATT